MPWWEQNDFSGGINQKPEEAEKNQVRDARNVWCRDGRLQTRPGTRGVSTYRSVSGAGTSGDQLHVWNSSTETFLPAAAGVFTLDDLPTGSIIYVGHDETFFRFYILFNGIAINSNETTITLEYYNGSDWLPLPHDLIWSPLSPDPGDGFRTSRDDFLASYPDIWFVPPGDWSTVSINSGDAAYHVRITIGTTALDGNTEISDTPKLYLVSDSSEETAYLPAAAHVIEFPSHKVYLYIPTKPAGASSAADVYTTHGLHMIDGVGTNPTIDAAGYPEPVSIAADLVWNKAYFSAGYTPLELDADKLSISAAAVETDASLVGTVGTIKASYHPDYVVQLGAWPMAKYWELFHDELFCANIIDAPFMFRWSGPGDAHRVWPAESFEQLVEDDRSPIIGMKAFGEHLSIFKRDSIWRVTFGGESGLTGLNTYIPIKIPGAIGTVSNSSIVEVNGVLLFLSEGGVYAFDGVNKPTKISGPIDQVVESLGGGAQSRAVGVHWKRKNTYLLAVASDGSETNDLVLAYDYEKGGWWIWDLDVSIWMKDEGTGDLEELYFMDSYGQMFHLSDSYNDDHGTAIDDWVQFHRIGYEDQRSKTFRQVRLAGQSQDISAMTLSLEKDDGAVSDTSASIDWRSSNEAKVGGSGVTCTTAGTYTVYSDRRDHFKLNIREDCRWLGIKIENGVQHRKMFLDSISVMFINKRER